MWEMIICVAAAFGNCQERPPVYFAGREFCYRAMATEQKKPNVKTVYCREVRK